ncbi:hypothetical protein DEFR109230_08575 [Deinococcus frigens]
MGALSRLQTVCAHTDGLGQLHKGFQPELALVEIGLDVALLGAVDGRVHRGEQLTLLGTPDLGSPKAHGQHRAGLAIPEKGSQANRPEQFGEGHLLLPSVPAVKECRSGGPDRLGKGRSGQRQAAPDHPQQVSQQAVRGHLGHPASTNPPVKGHL